MTEISIIDYGLGNVLSLKRACEKFGASVTVTSDHGEIVSSAGLVLPGVGAFGKAASLLSESKLDSVIIDYVKSGKPLIGICLGMQILFETGYEFGRFSGLGILEGEVKPLVGSQVKRLDKIPNVGWFNIKKNQSSVDEESLFPKKRQDEKFYFVHSYSCIPADPSIITSVSTFDDKEFVASIRCKNIFGFQFHPEKSGVAGLRIIENFVNLCRRKDDNQ